MLAFRRRMVSSGRRTMVSLPTGEHQNKSTFSQSIRRKTWKAWSTSTSQQVFLLICVVLIR